MGETVGPICLAQQRHLKAPPRVLSQDAASGRFAHAASAARSAASLQRCAADCRNRYGQRRICRGGATSRSLTADRSSANFTTKTRRHEDISNKSGGRHAAACRNVSTNPSSWHRVFVVKLTRRHCAPAWACRVDGIAGHRRDPQRFDTLAAQRTPRTTEEPCRTAPRASHGMQKFNGWPVVRVSAPRQESCSVVLRGSLCPPC